MGIQIAPSLLSCDFAKLGEEVRLINSSLADWLHLDIMDGVFVPNISFGIEIVRTINNVATKPLDVHLMIVNPENYIETFREAGADNITVHAEACIHLHRVIQQIKSCGANVGVALNPHTPVSTLQNVIEMVDMVCLMSVNPGFGGQKFITKTFHKIEKLAKMIQRLGLKTQIEIDGGVNLSIAQDLANCGANILVAGNAIFSDENPKEAIRLLKDVSKKDLHIASL